MKQNRKKYIQNIEDQQQNSQQIYDPFRRNITQQINFNFNNKKFENIGSLKCCVTLFQDQSKQEQEQQQQQLQREKFQTVQRTDTSIYPQVQTHVMKQINMNRGINDKDAIRQTASQVENTVESEKKIKNNILDKIIANKSKIKNYEIISKKQKYPDEQFGFNTNFRVAYPQTPGFKNLLHSPFGKFNSIFKVVIQTLSKDNEIQPEKKEVFQPVELNANPLLFYNKSKNFDAAKFFIGITLKLKQTNHINQSLYFCCLACYAEPYNPNPWKKYISFLQQQGKLSKACVLAKTGYLFTQNQELIKNFFIYGQRCGMDLHKLQGIMCSISNPEAYQKTLLPQSSKLQIKYGKQWKGLKLIWQICKSNDYKLSICILTLFLARYLQNIGYPQISMYILKKSFSKSMSKLQIYLSYLQISIRKNRYIVQEDLQEVLKYTQCISAENRYRFMLEIAELLFKNNDQRYYLFLENAYRCAMKQCASGAGCVKAVKQIYYTTAKLTKITPKVKNVVNDITVFQLNRHRFINGKQLIQHQFQDWKYYLHYGVVQRYDLLAEAAKKWPLTGRIIAQWIHCLRIKRKPLEMLKIWRDKIDQVPKSGELWCEGGRIYAQLKQYGNAEKCFRCAMHFTPQYGDSFIEELKLLLQESRFLEIEKLKKLFLVCQPFYGHVLSYLKQNHWQNSSITLNEVWHNALYQISNDLYKQDNYKQVSQSTINTYFTAYQPYNFSYIHKSTHIQRERLFISYEQMENKN